MSSVNQDAIDAVELALNTLGCSQKELALKLKVSPTQISKWKNGEYMSFEMEDRIKEQTKIGEHRPAVVLWAGSVPRNGKSSFTTWQKSPRTAAKQDTIPILSRTKWTC